jgi:hypothetical protein
MSPVTEAIDHERDFEAAARAFRTSRLRSADGAPDLVTFASQLQFFLTIGYLTKEQAEALVRWFQSVGMMKLPPLPGPDGISGPTMSEILSTAIHFGTPQEVFDVEGIGPVAAGIGDFFSGLVQGIGDLVDTALDGVTSVLEAGTGLIQAGTELVHELHALTAV